ncbi:hypothetical protein PI124_g11396 [Phytophthora idaei]|nr:hypothetical protein PI124_g11396 [Phytophthora idaei]
MEILSGPYTFRTTKPLVDRLGLPPIEVNGALVVRRYNVGQQVPVIKAIPQAERIRHAIQAIEDTKNLDLLARWVEYGYATYDQLKLMENVVAARNNFNLVQATIEWIDKVEFQVDCIVEPFKDTLDVTKADHKNAVEDMNLDKWYIWKHTQYGCEQKDSSSCGPWRLVVLEHLLFGATSETWSDYWSDSLYDVMRYLRMRYLHKIIKLQNHMSVPVDDGVEEE